MTRIPARRTVVVVDVARYTDIAVSLEASLGAEGVAELNAQVKAHLQTALHATGLDRQSIPVKWTGDGAILSFEDALSASRFGAEVHRLQQKDHERFHFRIGIATGEVIIDQDLDASGIPVAVAARLEGASRTGEVLIDTSTAKVLPADERQFYGPEEVVAGKRTEVYHVHRRRVVDSASWDRASRSSRERKATATTFYVQSLNVENVKGTRQAQIHLRDVTGPENHAFQRDLITLLNSGLLPDGFAVTDIHGDNVVLATPDDEDIPLRSASDGLRCMIAMVLDIVRSLEDSYGAVDLFEGKIRDGGVVLIDEPDNHLHVLWQIRLASWMKEHFPKIQFIVASHSPFICVGADKIWRLDDENGKVDPRELPENEMRAIWNGPVSAILESDAFRVFNTLGPEARNRHWEYLKLHELVLQGSRLSEEQQTRLAELEEKVLGPEIPSDPDFDKLFP
jgi:class 3 adenylate cyclase